MVYSDESATSGHLKILYHESFVYISHSIADHSSRVCACLVIVFYH